MENKTIRELTMELMNATIGFQKEMRRELTTKEISYLEYFWNKKKKIIREAIYLDYIAFVVNDGFSSELHETKKAFIKIDLSKLCSKGYLEEGKDSQGVLYKLTAIGMNRFKDLHPNIISVIERFIDKTPAWVGLLMLQNIVITCANL